METEITKQRNITIGKYKKLIKILSQEQIAILDNYEKENDKLNELIRNL